MMNFRDFVLNEDFGLGNLGQNIDRVFKNPNFVRHGGAYVNGDVSSTNYTDFGSLEIPPTNLEVPQMETTSRISVLLLKRNPIFMKLENGTEASFTYDEWKRIKGEPAIGKTVTLILQRHPNYRGQDHSKIEQVIVRD